MKPAISVVVPTFRAGGLDLLFDSLAQQSTFDFELVLVDALHARRRDLVRDRAAAYPFTVTHVPPRPSAHPFPHNNFCAAFNTGVVYARADLMLVTADYAWFSPTTIAEHIQAQRKSPGAVLGGYTHRACPPMDPVIDYGPTADRLVDEVTHDRSLEEAADRYVADLHAGKLDHLMWSTFVEPFNGVVDALAVTTDMRGRGSDWQWCHFKGDSFRIADLLAVNGCDEEMDACVGYQDWNLAERLNRHGARWTKIDARIDIVNPRAKFYARKLARPPAENVSMVGPHRPIRANPNFDLAALRERAKETRQ